MVAMEVQETPFVKQLAASDRQTREKALTSLQTYLSCGRAFTDLELLKIWKGLFFCIYHTDRPLPQQRLSRSLAALLLSLPVPLFLPFLHAFYSTIIAHFPSLPSLRLDKYLYLIRLYISHGFIYLARYKWEEGLVGGYLDLIEELPLSVGDGRVPDGLRYHVLDVWVDGLMEVEGWEGKGLMRPVERLAGEGRTKVVRGRARGVLGDERLEEGGAGSNDVSSEDEGEESEFEGFEE